MPTKEVFFSIIRASVWTSLVPPDVSVDWGLYGIHMINSNEGWAVGVDHTNKRGVLLQFTKDPDELEQDQNKKVYLADLSPSSDRFRLGIEQCVFPLDDRGMGRGSESHREKRDDAPFFHPPLG